MAAHLGHAALFHCDSRVTGNARLIVVRFTSKRDDNMQVRLENKTLPGNA